MRTVRVAAIIMISAFWGCREDSVSCLSMVNADSLEEGHYTETNISALKVKDKYYARYKLPLDYSYVFLFGPIALSLTPERDCNCICGTAGDSVRGF